MLKQPTAGKQYRKYLKKTLVMLRLRSISKKINKKVIRENIKIFNLFKFIFSLLEYKIKQHNKAMIGIKRGFNNLL